ncbi:hypothetical protein ADUPG1_006120, partial [Aduncisulcus paluster]
MLIVCAIVSPSDIGFIIFYFVLFLPCLCSPKSTQGLEWAYQRPVNHKMLKTRLMAELTIPESLKFSRGHTHRIVDSLPENLDRNRLVIPHAAAIIYFVNICELEREMDEYVDMLWTKLIKGTPMISTPIVLALTHLKDLPIDDDARFKTYIENAEKFIRCVVLTRTNTNVVHILPTLEYADRQACGGMYKSVP